MAIFPHVSEGDSMESESKLFDNKKIAVLNDGDGSRA